MTLMLIDAIHIFHTPMQMFKNFSLNNVILKMKMNAFQLCAAAAELIECS